MECVPGTPEAWAEPARSRVAGFVRRAVKARFSTVYNVKNDTVEIRAVPESLGTSKR